MGEFLHKFFSPLGFRRAVPQVWDGFQTNIKLMVIAEVLVLFLALVFAIVRGLPGRGTLPLRVLAITADEAFKLILSGGTYVPAGITLTPAV